LIVGKLSQIKEKQIQIDISFIHSNSPNFHPQLDRVSPQHHLIIVIKASPSHLFSAIKDLSGERKIINRKQS
jgi:hypothetical protein